MTDACPVCGGHRTVRSARFGDAGFVDCCDCGFIFRPDRDSAAGLAPYAGGDYEEAHAADYLRDLPARRRDARVRLDYLARWVRDGRLLDVGTASGAFVAEALERGFHAEGVEPAPAFVRMAREQLGITVTQAGIDDFRGGGEPYAAVTLWHVLEHLSEPVGALRRIAAILDAGGVVAVEVPNAGSLSARRMRAAWPSLQADVHVNQFAPSTLALALERAGLEPLDLVSLSVTPYLTRAATIAPRHLAARAKAAVALGDVRSTHPWGHELLRATARRVKAPSSSGA